MIEIDLGLFTKLERGTHTERVKVTRGGRTFYREQRVGVKPSRKDTGKIASLPDEIKKEILELRRIGYSGAKIKESIEGMINHGLHADEATERKIDVLTEDFKKLHSKKKAETDSEKIKQFDAEMDKKYEERRKLNLESEQTKSTYVDGKPTGRNFLEEGIIDKDGKLNVTGQSLVDWTKVRGVESPKKRKTVKAVEAKSKEELDRQFKEANEKLARLKVENKELAAQITSERKSKDESDKIRSQLRNENLVLREKLKALEAKE